MGFKERFEREVEAQAKIKARHLPDHVVNEMIQKSLNGNGNREPNRWEIIAAHEILTERNYQLKKRGYVNYDFGYKGGTSKRKP